jgi:dGTP triphosphohydrolase
MFSFDSGKVTAATLDRLSAQVQALEQRCEALSAALHERDEALKQVQLDQLVVAKRAEEDRDRAEKAIAGLLERLETLRRRFESGPGADLARRDGRRAS